MCILFLMSNTRPTKKKSKKLAGCFDGLRGHEIEMTLEEAQSCSHQGQCSQDVEFLLSQPHIKSQFANFTADQIKESLKESGAWEDEDLQDEETNQQRALWFAACDIAENHR